MILILGLVVVGGYAMTYSGLASLKGQEISTIAAFVGPDKIAGTSKPKAKTAPATATRRPGRPARIHGHTSRG